MIVTSQPDIACDVCGRRLLRGEQPDVFLAGGRRQTVCELCAPRAAQEGWLRETDREGDSLHLAPARPRRARNLLGRLRLLRRGQVERAGSGTQPEELGRADSPQGRSGPGALDAAEPWPAQAPLPPPVPPAPDPAPGSYEDPLEGLPVLAEEPAVAHKLAVARESGLAGLAAKHAAAGGVLEARRALEVFNAGEHPRRVAGVARSLGAPSVTVRALGQSPGTVVAIVIAWELSWYRYEVDLEDEASGVSVVAQGTELGELPPRTVWQTRRRLMMGRCRW